MAKFDWGCPDCEIYWEREYPVGKAPKRTRCPECNKLCERYVGNMNINISFKDDGAGNRGNGAMDFHTVRRRYQNHAKNGFDKDSANRFLNRSIRETKERMADESGRYKNYNIKWEEMARDGKARKLSDKEASAKRETNRKLTADAVENANNRGYNLDVTTGKRKKNDPQ
jgi:hypothetical protein